MKQREKESGDFPGNEEKNCMSTIEYKPFLSIAECSALLDAGKITPVDLIEQAIEATEKYQSEINAYITFRPEEARKEAEKTAAEIKKYGRKSMLHGIPFAVKDLIDAKGFPTTMGSESMKDHIAAEDAPTVAALKQSGAILMGKTNTQEWGIGPAGDQSYFGPVRNPYDITRISGGSSSGSCAAVAAGMVPMALGSDAGGSIRIPAALCSVVGLKTTLGLLKQSGDRKIRFASHLAVEGPIAASSEDAAIMMDALDRAHGGYRKTVLETDSLFGKKFAVPYHLFRDAVEPGVAKVFEESITRLEKAGAVIREAEFPWLAEIPALSSAITFPEVAYKHLERLNEAPESFQPFIRKRLETGFDYSALQYITALEKREEAIEKWQLAMANLDAVLMPTVPVTAYPLFKTTMEFLGEEKNCSELLVKHTRTANVIGCPALSVPAGFSGGLPVGLQMMGAMGADARLLGLGALFEKKRD